MYKTLKMLQLQFILIVAIVLLFAGHIYAQETTSTKSQPSPTLKDEREIKLLKEKIATKVAELQKNSRKVIAGEIVKKETDALDLKTSSGEVYKLTFDEILTKVYSVESGVKKNHSFSDLKKGDFIISYGSIIENMITPTLIYFDQEYIVGSGRITEVNKDDFSLKVFTTDKNEYTLDIETFTKQQSYDIATLGFSPLGFSKLKEGDTIHFVGKRPSDKKSVRFPASRILMIPQESFVKKKTIN